MSSSAGSFIASVIPRFPEDPKLTELKDAFPDFFTVKRQLFDIDEAFLLDSEHQDCWLKFLPLFKTMLKHQYEPSAEKAAYWERYSLNFFMQYAFATEDETNLIKADFTGRLESVKVALRFLAVRDNVNMVYRFGGWLKNARYLPTGDDLFEQELVEAGKKDLRRLCGGRRVFEDSDKSAKRIQGLNVQHVKRKFEFRKVYNQRLKEFREAVLVMLLETIMEYSPNYDNVDFEYVWSEVRIEGGIPEEERIRVEALVQEKMKARESEKKGAEVKGESSCK